MKRQERCCTAKEQKYNFAYSVNILKCQTKLEADSEQSGQHVTGVSYTLFYVFVSIQYTWLGSKMITLVTHSEKSDLKSYKPSMSRCFIQILQRVQNAKTLRRAYYSFTDLDNFHSIAIGSRLCTNMRTTQRCFCRCAHRAIVSTRRYLRNTCLYKHHSKLQHYSRLTVTRFNNQHDQSRALSPTLFYRGVVGKSQTLLTV